MEQALSDSFVKLSPINALWPEDYEIDDLPSPTGGFGSTSQRQVRLLAASNDVLLYVGRLPGPSGSAGSDVLVRWFRSSSPAPEYIRLPGARQGTAVGVVRLWGRQRSEMGEEKERLATHDRFLNPAQRSIFLSPDGHHALVSLSSGDNYYLASSPGAKLVPLCAAAKGVGISAVAWDRDHSRGGKIRARAE